MAETKKCVEEYGAFGAPWFWMTRDGVGEPSFGSDRFHYMYQFLGVPYRKMEVMTEDGEAEGKMKSVAKL